MISTVTTFLVAFALGAAAMGVIVHCRSRHLAAAISAGDHLTMKANTVLGLPCAVGVHNTPRLIRTLLCQPYVYLHGAHMHTADVSFH